MARYTTEIAATARAALARLRRQVPGAVEMVYDNYNALVISFSPSERASEAVVSIALKSISPKRRPRRPRSG